MHPDQSVRPPRSHKSKTRQRRTVPTKDADFVARITQRAQERADEPASNSVTMETRRTDRYLGRLSSSVIGLRCSLVGSQAQHRGGRIRGCAKGYGDASSSTSDTVSCTSDGSSCFDAEEGRDKSDATDEDGYDTDSAVVCDEDADTRSTSPEKNLICEEPTLDPAHIKKAQQETDQLMLEQAMAVEAWNEVAQEYERRIEPFTSTFIPDLLDSKFIKPSSDIRALSDGHMHLKGKLILDVAAGTGAGSMYAASKGASSVMATDFSAMMLHRLGRRIMDHPSQSTIETKVANGMCLPLEWENRYDIVMSNFGLIYFPKVKEGLREMIRCARPGGRVCLSGWGSKEETHAFSVFPAAMRRCGFETRWFRAQSEARKGMLSDAGIMPASPSRHERKWKKKKKYQGISLTPNYFCPTTRISSSPRSLGSMMSEAGLTDVRVVPVTKRLQLDGTESYWNRFVLASPNIRRFVEHCLSREEADRMKAAVSDILHRGHGEKGNSQEAGVVLRASAYIAVGTKTSW